jgi:hypothetical protein
MGNYFLYGLLVAFGIYEVVMHFVFKNAKGDQTLSNIIVKLGEKRWYVRAIVGSLLAFGFYHFHVFA